jgi:hypothetical protein
MLSSCSWFVGDNRQTSLPSRRKSPSTCTCRRRNARKSSCIWTSASVNTGPLAVAPPRRTFSATMPRMKRSRIRENSKSMPRSRKMAISRVLTNSGTPIWLNQMIAHKAASTTNHTLIRHQRKPTRHLCQKPGRIIHQKFAGMGKQLKINRSLAALKPYSILRLFACCGGEHHDIAKLPKVFKKDLLQSSSADMSARSLACGHRALIGGRG